MRSKICKIMKHSWQNMQLSQIILLLWVFLFHYSIFTSLKQTLFFLSVADPKFVLLWVESWSQPVSTFISSCVSLYMSFNPVTEILFREPKASKCQLGNNMFFSMFCFSNKVMGHWCVRIRVLLHQKKPPSRTLQMWH